MFRSTSQTRDAKRMTVAPSNRDSIGSWLDVLTSMLSLPEGERLQVRDELEDHLRSRVDDLLITGTDEQEAVRIAVAELGETAELAKLITHAHTRANPRRRIMNIALITAAIAGLSVGGISLQNQGSTGVLAGGESGGRLVHAEDGAQDQERVHTFALGSTSAYRVLEEIAIGFDRSFQVSRKVMNTDTERALAMQTQSFDGEMTLDQAVEAFHKAFDEVSGGFNVQVTDDAILYQTEEEYQRSRIVTRVLPLSEWIERHELFDYAKSLENLLSVKHDLSLASIEVVNETIVVAAIPEIHEEILKMVFELDAVIEQRQRERAKRQAAEQHELEVRRSKAYERIMIRHSEILHDLMNAKDELAENEGAIQALIQQIRLSEQHPKQDGPTTEDLKKLMNARSGISNRLRAQIAEDEDRERYLRERMVETEFLYLFDGLE